MDKALWRHWNLPHGLYSNMEKAWFYKRFFIEVVMVKDKNVMVKDNINTV